MAGGQVQSVARALRLLELAADSDRGLTLGELSSALELKVPTAFGLAKTLVAGGYLTKTSRPVRYRLGDGLVQLVQRHHRRCWLLRSEEAVRCLFAELGEATVLLAEGTGGDFAPRLRMDPSRPGVLERVVNRYLAPYSSAVALCFQAFWPALEAAMFRSRYPFAEYGLGLWRREAALEAFLSESRERGCVVGRNQPPRVAAPVFGAGQELLGCLGASLNGDSSAEGNGATIEPLERAVRGAASRLTAVLAATASRSVLPPAAGEHTCPERGRSGVDRPTTGEAKP
ncbi:MAG: helix-turn-helix domain-containing protein [Lentisphaeria bacterium]|nr:helix-turn-helix domain-containing protein [Lentisphaeria bacterium]